MANRTPNVDRELNVGGHNLSVVGLPDGTKLFRSDPVDVTSIDICLVDNSGRQRIIQAPRSTILVMVPVDGLGAVAFDPMQQTVGNAIMTAVDAEGRPCYAQRPAMTRAEVFDMIHEVIRKETSTVRTVSPHDLKRFGL